MVDSRDRSNARCIAGHVGVIGGGTAGYFAALALRRWFPDLPITLVESSTIPIIGVGEATTPPLVAFLHDYLGIDVHELYREVIPTWKMGIHFEWGPPGGFNYPFSWGDLADAYAHDGNIERASVGSLLMSAKRTPVLRTGDGVVSALHEIKYAYHLDNRRFVRFLKKVAERSAITYVDAEIADVVLREGPDGPEVAGLKTKDGQTLAYDYYVDCTGFRSLLIGKTYGTPFISYADTLYCDRAVVAEVPHDGTIKPYTLAESMDHGWCWNIPMVDEDHRGYVYSSAFCDQDQAVAEMKRKNPTMAEPWFVKFRSGRHEQFWRGNVVAVGNSYGFVEPLESTALHMVQIEVTRLVRLLDADRDGEDRDREVINRRIGAHWDYLRWFLGLHYRFNRRYDTPFWQACRERVNIEGLTDVVADFQANGALTARQVPRPPDAIFGAGGVDIMLLGQQVPTVPPASTRYDADGWQQTLARAQAFVAHALPHREALAELARAPQLLDDAMTRGWVRELGQQFWT